MPVFLVISIAIFIAIVLLALMLVAARIKRAEGQPAQDERGRHPRGYWVSAGMSIGAGLGVALGLVFDQLALGIAIGAGIGVAIGSSMEARKHDELHRTAEDERRIGLWVLALGVVAGFVFLAMFWILTRR